jgi:FeS assembly SUF system regulator
MLRIRKLTDYGIFVLAHLANEQDTVMSASKIASKTGLNLPTVSKLLKTLSKAKLVTSIRGSQGGYSLAKKSSTISAAEIIDAFEGPVAITECSASYHSCSLESQCGVGEAWQKINQAIRNTLENISLTDLRNGQNRKKSLKFSGIPINIKAH